MSIRDKKWVKYTLGGVGALVAGIALMLGATMMGHTAISQLAGLAVAQTTTLWNNVKDAAVGDGQSSGILAQATYLFNGVTFDRVRGTNGSMNVAPIGAITPADAYVNPSTALEVWSLNGVFNGTTWDRWDGGVSPAQGTNLFNTQTTGGATTAVTVTLTALASARAHIYSVEGRCNTAAATSDVLISSGGTTIWTSGPLGVTAAQPQFRREWPTGLTGATNSAMVVTLAACTAGTGTLMVQADKF